MNRDPHRYDDILDLPRHVSLNRRHMSNLERAAQFSPFKALSGYEDEVNDTARQREEKRILGEAEQAELDQVLQALAERIASRPVVTVTYFVKDEKKEGGQYAGSSFRLRRIDTVRRVLVKENREEIPLDDVLCIRMDEENGDDA